MLRISKKMMMFALLIVIVVIGTAFNLKDVSIANKPYEDLKTQNIFENDFFGTEIGIPDFAENIAPFSGIYTIIETEMAKSYPSVDARDIVIANEIEDFIDGRRVGIENALDLYHFSAAASFNYRNLAAVNRVPYKLMIQKIMGLDYILLSDIDYSIMKSRKFIPIGIDLTLEDQGEYQYPFTGTFDGQGFTISNLYLADYSYITTIYRIDDDPLTDTDLPLSPYYAMFNEIADGATVKNFILKDPIYDLIDAPEGIRQTSYIVGKNNGLIYNIAVVDSKVNQTGADISGIRFNIQFESNYLEQFTAAGFVHTNDVNGRIYNSYFVSKKIIADGSTSKFVSKPFFYDNAGTISSVAYDSIVLPSVDDDTQIDVNIYTTNELKLGLKDGFPISINNHQFQDESRKWNFYHEDGYPQLFGLNYDDDNDYFIINDEYDIVSFSKMIGLASNYDGIAYNAHNYYIANNIDMNNISAYKTPSVEFRGSLKGGSNDLEQGKQNTNKYIINLRMSVPTVVGNEYRLGFLGTINGGSVENINFYNNSILATNTEVNYGRVFYIGTVAAKTMNSATNIVSIKNIIANTSIDLGEQALGSTNIGGIVGYGNGNFSNLVNSGIINGNIHNFNNLSTAGRFNFGGIIGASSGSNLNLSNSINLGNITGIGSNTNYSVVGDDIRISIGGIIGEVNNSTESGNSLYYLTNNATIKAGSFEGKSNARVYQHIGGIFGNVVNYGFKLVENDNVTVRNGRLENLGNVEATHINNNTFYYTAGIGIASTSNTLADFSHMVNDGSYSFTGFNSNTHNRTMFYASTIIDNSSGGVRLSRAYNETDYVFNPSYFVTTTEIINIAPFFTSITNNDSELLYVENKGGLQVGSTSTTSNVNNELRIANITLASKVNYKNVYNSGNINVLNINQTSEVFVAGIAWILPYNNTGGNNYAYTAENVMNEGKIVTAGIQGNTNLSNIRGDGSRDSNYGSTLTSSNIYVAGLFNLNVGVIINSYNRGDISSTFSPSFKDITGTANTFVGGIVTINYNKMKDIGNSGNINFTNSNPSSITHIGNYDYSTSSNYAGLVIAYNGGLVLGGISAAFGDTRATILANNGKGVNILGEISDSSNNGNVYGKAKEYVRSAGILAIALGVELTSGTDDNNETAGEKKFSYSIPGAGDNIINFSLLNGLNFGNVSAITSTRAEYNRNVDNQNESATSANGERPGINAAAGGVIAYGLTKMERMLNHGVVASTDVAGGIVGATYILGSSSELTGITLVNINTAVHYGKIKAIRNTMYGSIDYELIENIFQNDIDNSTILYPDNNDFIFPISNYNLSIYPNKKRGFGGIFGRLQRGPRGSMRSNNFINILNMDPNVDMVGRVDQSSWRSRIYFRFKIEGEQDTYYTARDNDTTQASLVGVITSLDYTFTNATSVSYKIERSGTNNNRTYTIREATFTNGSGYYNNVKRYISPYHATSSGSESSYVIENRNVPFKDESRTFTNLNLRIPAFGLSVSEVEGLFSSNTTITYNDPHYNNTHNSSVNRATHTGSPTSNNPPQIQYNIEKVTDDPTDNLKTYIFNQNFPLMDADQTDFIYRAENDALAPRFRDEGTIQDPNPNYKEHGMYVLASTLGREAGAVLPGNIKISKFYKLNEAIENYIDLENIKTDSLIYEGAEVDALMADFGEMYQLSYNEKSLILGKEDNDGIADLVLYDKNNVSPRLQGGILNNEDKTITFHAASNAFTSTGVNYVVESARTSENAVIALSGIDSTNFSNFRSAYDSRDSNVLRGDYEATLSGTVTTGTTTLPTKLTVYSQIAAQMGDLVGKYKTEYDIIIVRDSNSSNISLETIHFDGTSITVPSLVGNSYTVNPADNVVNSKIDINFRELNGLFPINHEITFVGLYYNDGTTSTLVDSNYYDLDIRPVDSTNRFGFSITLDNRLKSGNYEAKYKYYNNTSEFSIIFNKGISSEYSVTGVNYETYSSDSLGNSIILEPQNNNFRTYIGFGVTLDGILYDSNVVHTDIEQITNEDLPVYIDKVLYYKLKINNNHILELHISPFATLDSFTTSYNYIQTNGDTKGFREFIITYTITPEYGPAETIEHRILERSLSDIIVYKNGNLENPENISIDREEWLTQIFVDFGFPYKELNGQVRTEILNGQATYPDTEVYFKNDVYYEIYITNLLDKGILNYSFRLEREHGNIVDLKSINIEKLEGTDAYLRDIRFQIDSDQIIFYPLIYTTDSQGNRITIPDKVPGFYFNGIDYADTDVGPNPHKYFRIDGRVSDIDLEYYSPEFTIPIGATIERRTGENSWSEVLYADFIGFDSEEDVVIEYRITSEDSKNTVYYFITAIDILYNLTIRFSLYYRDINNNIVPISDPTSAIKNQVVVINVKNFKLKEFDEDDNPIIYEPPYEQGGKIHYPYENEGITNYVDSLNTHASLFYFPHQYSNFSYTFGRNLTGAYSFTVIPPIYNGPNYENHINGKRYTYDIFLMSGAVGNDPYPWNQPKYLLPDFSDEGQYAGRYFYIVGYPRQIVRDFAIVINHETYGFDWGLDDDYSTWD